MKLFEENEPKPIEVKGHQLRCPVCDNTNFWMRKALLNTAGLTFFNLDWADKSATCFICSECTHIDWFLGY
jgi:hypothetical protein